MKRELRAEGKNLPRLSEGENVRCLAEPEVRLVAKSLDMEVLVAAPLCPTVVGVITEPESLWLQVPAVVLGVRLPPIEPELPLRVVRQDYSSAPLRSSRTLSKNPFRCR